MKRATIRCPYCRAKATLHPASYVHGNAAIPGTYLYVCDRYPRCDAYVGAHTKTRLPMGSLANGDLRHKRIEAHKAFNWLWKSGLMSRSQAYIWLQAKLGLSPEQAHIGKFNDYMCDRLIEICHEIKSNYRAVHREEAKHNDRTELAEFSRGKPEPCSASHSFRGNSK